MSYPVRVKICGITHPDDLAAAITAGADAIGLNFHPPSPRYVTPAQARAMLSQLPPFIEPVGVFVRQSVAELRDLLDEVALLRTIQMHGGSYEVHNPSPHRYIPAFQVRAQADLAAITRYLDQCRHAGWQPGAILIDGHAPGLVGGTGQTAPWDLLAEFHPGVPVILAGGLTPENVAEAVTRVRPWAVDVASGVESSPGRKDADRMRQFIDAARNAGQRSG
jgi:phosphoribosylanthranilate isomerase